MRRFEQIILRAAINLVARTLQEENLGAGKVDGIILRECSFCKKAGKQTRQFTLYKLGSCLVTPLTYPSRTEVSSPLAAHIAMLIRWCRARFDMATVFGVLLLAVFPSALDGFRLAFLDIFLVVAWTACMADGRGIQCIRGFGEGQGEKG